MTAPTQGKARRVTSAAPGPLSPASYPALPSLPFPAPLAPCAREPRALGERGPSSVSPELLSRSRHPEKFAPRPPQIELFRPGPPFARCSARAWLRDLGVPSLGAKGAGRRRTAPLQEPRPTFRGTAPRPLGSSWACALPGTWASPQPLDASRGREEVMALPPGFGELGDTLRVRGPARKSR
jgi:hypothetical protein